MKKKEYVTYDVMTNFGDKFYGTLRFLKTPFKITFDEMVNELYRKYPTLKGMRGVILQENT